MNMKKYKWENELTHVAFPVWKLDQYLPCNVMELHQYLLMHRKLLDQ